MQQCWRCKDEFIPKYPGIYLEFIVMIKIGYASKATLPQPLCQTCIESFQDWCNKYAKEVKSNG